MENMFYGPSSFNGDISGWQVGSVTNMQDMFMDAPGPCACPASELLDSSWLDFVCAPSGAACLVPCAANEHVISNACVECNGLTNAPGDYPVRAVALDSIYTSYVASIRICNKRLR